MGPVRHKQRGRDFRRVRGAGRARGFGLLQHLTASTGVNPTALGPCPGLRALRSVGDSPRAAAPPADLRVHLTPGPALESKAAGPSSPSLPFPQLPPAKNHQPGFPADAGAPPLVGRGSAPWLGGTQGRGPAHMRVRACARAVLFGQLRADSCGVGWLANLLGFTRVSPSSGLAFGPFAKTPVTPGRMGPRAGSDGEGGIRGLRLRPGVVKRVGSKPVQHRVNPRSSANTYGSVSSSKTCSHVTW